MKNINDVIVKIDVWYDDCTDLWVVQKLNSANEQVERAEHFTSKEEALNFAKELENFYDIKSN